VRAGLVLGALFDPGVLAVPAVHLVVSLAPLPVVLGKVFAGPADFFLFHINHLAILISYRYQIVNIYMISFCIVAAIISY
jgi:hypothetical protein